MARHCPKAVVALVTGPVTALLPVASETLKAAGTYNPRRLLGVTTIDVVRFSNF